MKKHAKLTLRLPAETKDRLDALREADGCRSLSELVRRALGTYELLIESHNEGKRVLIEDKTTGLVWHVVLDAPSNPDAPQLVAAEKE